MVFARSYYNNMRHGRDLSFFHVTVLAEDCGRSRWHWYWKTGSSPTSWILFWVEQGQEGAELEKYFQKFRLKGQEGAEREKYFKKNENLRPVQRPFRAGSATTGRLSRWPATISLVQAQIA